MPVLERRALGAAPGHGDRASLEHRQVELDEHLPLARLAPDLRRQREHAAVDAERIPALAGSPRGAEMLHAHASLQARVWHTRGGGVIGRATAPEGGA